MAEAIILREFHHRFQPEFGMTGCVLRVHVRPRFFAREEVESISANTKDRGTHANVIGSPAEKLLEIDLRTRKSCSRTTTACSGFSDQPKEHLQGRSKRDTDGFDAEAGALSVHHG